MLLIVSIVVSLNYRSKLTEIDWFVGKFNHSDIQTLVNAIGVSVRAQSNYAALVMLVIIRHHLKNLSCGLESIHLRLQEVH